MKIEERNSDSFLKVGKDKETDSLLEPLKKHWTANTLILNPVKLILDSDFENCKIINSCCTPPSLQYCNSSYRKKIQILVPASGGAAATNTKKHRNGFEIR